MIHDHLHPQKMFDLKTFCIILALSLSACGSPSHGWRHDSHQYLHHHHHNRPHSTPLASKSTANTYAGATGTAFPTLSILPASGTAPNRQPSGSVGTASFSIQPTARKNTSYSLGSSGSLPVPTSILPINTTKLPATKPIIAPTNNASVPAPSGTPYPGFLRGVNIGGWLLLDSVLNANLLSKVAAVDQWTFDSLPGADATLQSHWDTYFTEASVQLLKSYGINAIKIPIGYWAWDNSGTPYKSGADAYLEKAIGWAEAAGMKVWIDVSNTDSTQTTTAEISNDQALAHSLAVLSTVAKKYGCAKYANTVTAIEIFSSPITLPSTDLSTIQNFAKQAYSTIRTASTNPNLQIVMPDISSSPKAWETLATSLCPTKGMFSVAETLLQTVTSADQALTQDQHIQTACSRGIALAGINHDQMAIYVGDFSAATNATMNVEGWTDAVVQQVRKYVEAQLETFEAYTSGYFLWSWAVDSEEVAGVGWGIKAGIEKGYIPNPLNDPNQRKYPGQCDA